MRSLILLFLLLLVPGSALASEPTDYAGTFVLADEEAAATALKGAVEQGAQQFAALLRPIVRGRLRGAVNATGLFTFEPGDGSMRIRTGENKEGWTTDLVGTVVDVAGANGDPLKLKRWMEGGVLNAEGCSEKGCSDFVFTLAGDGKSMVLGVVTRANALKEPLRYQLNYKRQ